MTGALFRKGARATTRYAVAPVFGTMVRIRRDRVLVVCFGNPDDCILPVRRHPAFVLDLQNRASSTRSTRERFHILDENEAPLDAAWTLR